LIYHSQTF